MAIPRFALTLLIVLGLPAAVRGEDDCNGNGVDDEIDIATGESYDCDGDGVPDECTTPLGFYFPFRQQVRAGLLPDSGYPQPLVAEDLDGDGWVDFAVARKTEHGLAFVWNEGGKRFSRVQDVLLPADYAAQDFTAFDLDGDGDLDFAVARAPAASPQFWRSGLALVRNDGGRAFTFLGVIDFPELPYHVAAGDFDGDGAVDLVVTHGQRWLSSDPEDSTFDTAVSILWNDGRGAFLPPERLEMQGSATRSIYAVDLTGDGLADILALHWRGSPVLRLSQGGRRFSPPIAVSEALDGPFDAGFADVDGDGDLDMAFGEADTNRLSLFRNDGAGRLVPWAEYRHSRDTDRPVFADLDLDGHLDIVAGANGNDIWYGDRSSGLPLLGQHVRYACGGSVMGRAVRDIDKDGWPDIITHNWRARSGAWDDISILYNRGDGRFAAPELYYSYDVRRFWTGRPIRTVCADFDRDGHLDIASGRGFVSYGFAVMFNWGDGEGGFEEQDEVAMPNTMNEPIAARWIDAADLDGDGDPDLVGVGAHGWLVVENLGDRQFIERARRDEFPGGEHYSGALARDFDGDGRIDFAYVEDDQVDPRVSLVWNGGDWSFSQPQRVPDDETPAKRGTVTSLAAGDWDGDGQVDLLIVQGIVSTLIRWLFNEGDRSFRIGREVASESPVLDAHVADFNGDGADDIALAVAPKYHDTQTTDESVVEVLLNDGNGRFAIHASRAIRELFPYVNSGDLDGDGDEDILITGGWFVTSQSSETPGSEDDVEVLLNRGDGSLGRRLSLPFDSSPAQAVVEDFNSDGKPDLAVSLRQSVMLAVSLNEAPGPVTLPNAPPCARRFVRGDVYPDGEVDGVDARMLLYHLFLGEGPTRCVEALDANDDSRLDLTDAVFLLNFVYLGGPVLPPPYPECGIDPTPDPLGCEDTPTCDD